MNTLLKEIVRHTQNLPDNIQCEILDFIMFKESCIQRGEHGLSNTDSQMTFMEDDEQHLESFLKGIDEYIKEKPDIVEELDSDIFALADELVDGVEI